MSTTNEQATALPKWTRYSEPAPTPQRETLKCEVTGTVSIRVSEGAYGSAFLHVWCSDERITRHLSGSAIVDLEARKRVALPALLASMEEALPVVRAMVAELE